MLNNQCHGRCRRGGSGQRMNADEIRYGFPVQYMRIIGLNLLTTFWCGPAVQQAGQQWRCESYGAFSGRTPGNGGNLGGAPCVTIRNSCYVPAPPVIPWPYPRNQHRRTFSATNGRTTLFHVVSWMFLLPPVAPGGDGPHVKGCHNANGNLPVPSLLSQEPADKMGTEGR